MFGDDEDDSSGDSQQSGGGTDRASELAAAAEGASVTAARLRGEERYFPDCRGALQEDQRPQHLVLLTTSMWAVELRSGGDHGAVTVSADEGGVLVLTDDVALAVVDGRPVGEVPFSRVDGTFLTDEYLVLHDLGAGGFKFNVATSADEGEVGAAYDYLRRKVREHARR